MVERLFLAVPRGCLRIVIVVFPDHTHLLFLKRLLGWVSLGAAWVRVFWKYKVANKGLFIYFDRQTEGCMGKTICLPTLAGTNIIVSQIDNCLC